MSDQEKLKALLSYDQESGIFVWLIANNGNVRRGDIAGCVNDNGYIRIDVLGKQWPAHRLAWLYMTGAWPEKTVDHINLVKTDNRWTNLRLATPSQNKMNSRIRPDNTSGYKGVSRTPNGRWKACCTAEKRNHYLGLYDTPEAASAAYQEFAKKAHGQFFRPH